MASTPLKPMGQARFAIDDVISDNSAEEIGEKLKDLDQSIRTEHPGADEVRFSVSEGELCASWQTPRREPQPYDPEVHRQKIERRQAAIRRKAMKRLIEARRTVSTLEWKPTEPPAEPRDILPSAHEKTDAS